MPLRPSTELADTHLHAPGDDATRLGIDLLPLLTSECPWPFSTPRMLEASGWQVTEAADGEHGRTLQADQG